MATVSRIELNGTTYVSNLADPLLISTENVDQDTEIYNNLNITKYCNRKIDIAGSVITYILLLLLLLL